MRQRLAGNLIWQAEQGSGDPAQLAELRKKSDLVQEADLIRRRMKESQLTRCALCTLCWARVGGAGAVLGSTCDSEDVGGVAIAPQVLTTRTAGAAAHASSASSTSPSRGHRQYNLQYTRTTASTCLHSTPTAASSRRAGTGRRCCGS